MKTTRLLACAAVVLAVGCDESSAVKETLRDAGGARPGPAADAGSSDADCFVDPKTHFEIINACTTATRITKNPILPKLLPDGGLPPLE
jgi:hypothetical protein